MEDEIRKLVENFGESVSGSTEYANEPFRKLLVDSAFNDIMKIVNSYIEIRSSYWRTQTEVTHDSTQSA